MTWDEMSHGNDEYAAAYEVVRHAMTLVGASDICSKLQMLKNVLHLAAVFVNDELDELPERAAELGLDSWQQEEKNWLTEKEEGEV